MQRKTETFKQRIKREVPPFAIRALAAARSRVAAATQLMRYGQIVPWSRAYDRHQRDVIARALDDPRIRECFQQGQPLPRGYGVGVDERCVEYPWLMTRLKGFRTVLDAGSTLNHEFLLHRHPLNDVTLHVMTLAPEQDCFWRLGVSYLFEDLRRIPIRDGYYDAVVCVSTLEHVGFDNTSYTGDSAHHEHQPEDFVIAIREMRRVLRPGGELLLTVPFGEYRALRTCQQFDQPLLARAVEAFGSVASAEYGFFRYSREGWQWAAAEECAKCKYVEWIEAAAARGVRPRRVPIEPDWAAAARAVACVRLVTGRAAEDVHQPEPGPPRATP